MKMIKSFFNKRYLQNKLSIGLINAVFDNILSNHDIIRNNFYIVKFNDIIDEILDLELNLSANDYIKIIYNKNIHYIIETIVDIRTHSHFKEENELQIDFMKTYDIIQRICLNLQNNSISNIITIIDGQNKLCKN